MTRLLPIIIFSLLVPTLIVPAPVWAAPNLRTAQPIYTLRDSQAMLIGSGYGPQPYYVWLKGPADNHTAYSGLGFSPVSGGLIPPTEALSITANSMLGTYLVSISTSSTVDDAQSVAHFGIWGTSKPLYQRTESVKILGGGLFPGTSFKLSLRDPSGNYVMSHTIVAAATGSFNYSWRIPANGITETYKVLVDGTGTFDNAQQDYVSEARFSVTAATLTVNTVLQPNPVYERTELATVSYSLTYPDGTPVGSGLPGIHPALLVQNQSIISFASLVLIDQASGIWQAQAKLPVNATPSKSYRFDLPAMSFDDGYGNTGGPVDSFSNFFQVNNASLVISSSINGTQIQIPFGQVSIISKITYPDGTALTNGTAVVSISGSSLSRAVIQLGYDPILGAWRASYSSAFSDIWHIGTWTLRVQASDGFGNSGTATYEVTAQPYLFISLVGLLVVLAVFGRWIISRFGRRLYFRVRKLTRRLHRPDSLSH